MKKKFWLQKYGLTAVLQNAPLKSTIGNLVKWLLLVFWAWYCSMQELQLVFRLQTWMCTEIIWGSCQNADSYSEADSALLTNSQIHGFMEFQWVYLQVRLSK